MRISLRYITDRATDFVPERIFQKKGNEKIWFVVNYGRFPPIEFISLTSDATRLGIDGQYIEVNVDPKQVNLYRGNVLTIENYDFYLAEIED